MASMKSTLGPDDAGLLRLYLRQILIQRIRIVPRHQYSLGMTLTDWRHEAGPAEAKRKNSGAGV